MNLLKKPIPVTINNVFRADCDSHSATIAKSGSGMSFINLRDDEVVAQAGRGRSFYESKKIKRYKSMTYAHNIHYVKSIRHL